MPHLHSEDIAPLVQEELGAPLGQRHAGGCRGVGPVGSTSHKSLPSRSQVPAAISGLQETAWLVS